MRIPFAFRDLVDYRRADLRPDLVAAATVTVLSIPQALAYAVIAGLPPVMGLYAAAVPAIVGSLLRSSRHVVTGPSNALSLLVGGIIAAREGLDPVAMAITLAALVGIMQTAAGLLRLGALADYISRPVVLGYVTGAGLLLVVGQLSNLTGTAAHRGLPAHRIAGWFRDLDHTQLLPLAIGLGTVLLMLGLRAVRPRWPGALIATLLGLGLSLALDLPGRGLAVIGDLGAIPASLPSPSLPNLGHVGDLLPSAFACALLSLVESASVARAIATRSRQHVDMSVEFAGQGAANLAGALFGAYPTSGSLARSTLNASAGARSRLSGALSGVAMLVLPPLFGSTIEGLPIATLAGLICVVAVDLVDLRAIRAAWGGNLGDRLTFAGTLLGTWTLPLDTAIEVGVGLSLLGFLRQARMLTVNNLAVASHGFLQEREFDPARDCPAIRILQVEGSLFFGAAGELQGALEAAMSEPEVRVLLLRLKRTRELDLTTATLLAENAEQYQSSGRHLVLAGLPPEAMATLRRTGAAARIGEANMFETRAEWFHAMRLAMDRAVELAGHHACGDSCPVANVSERRNHGH